MILESEGRPSIADPTWSQIEGAIDAIHPRTSSYVILERAPGWYLQAAGAKLRLILETRRRKGLSGFEHFVLGRGCREQEKLTSLNYSGGAIQLFPSEIFSIREAKDVFREFFQTGGLPAAFALRDVSREQGGDGISAP